MASDNFDSAGGAGPLDGLYADKNKILLIVLAVCPCTSGIVFILSLICFLTAKSPSAKANSKLLIIIALALTLIGMVLGALSGGLSVIMGGGAR